MNKITFTICALYMLCISCTSSAQINYTINGTATNVKNGDKVYLMDAELIRKIIGNFDAKVDIAIIDSTSINNNSFKFKGTRPKTSIVYITLQKSSFYRSFPPIILESGIINVSLDNKKVTGTPMNDILNIYDKKINAFDNELYALRKQKSKLKENQKDERAILEREYEEVDNKQVAFIKECINKNLDNIIGAYLLNRYQINLSEEEIIQILTDASPALKENDLAKECIEYVETWKRTAIGQKFIDFKMKDPNNGKEVALSDYIDKGKYVLFDVWGMGCGACLLEIPYLKAAYEKFKSKGFEIVGVCDYFKKEDYQKATKDLGITWPLYEIELETGSLYGIRFVPFTCLIDPDGIIIAKDLQGEEIEKKLSELLN